LYNQSAYLMSSVITYSEARQHLAELMEQVAADRKPVVITRRNGENAVLMSESDYNSLLETAYLLRSPVNARRLLTALERSRAGGGTPMSVAEIRLAMELEKDETPDEEG
jgi:antitoxin YefM